MGPGIRSDKASTATKMKNIISMIFVVTASLVVAVFGEGSGSVTTSVADRSSTAQHLRRLSYHGGNTTNTTAPCPKDFVTLCRRKRVDSNLYATVQVNASNVARIALMKSIGAVEGTCKDTCSSLCNHTPCFNDFKVTLANESSRGAEQCRCYDKALLQSKCANLPNVKCGFNDTCACQYGFWGTNVSAFGCPDPGFSIRDLPYAFSALEPNIDTYTMFLHTQRHHAAAVLALNRAVNGTPKILMPILDLQATAIADGAAIRNNGGSHYNHAFFWTILASPADSNKTAPSAQLQALINSSFGNTTNMIALFNTVAGPGVFGSGWAWICVSLDGTRLIIVGTPNQDNPLMNGVVNETMFPILGLDVWEHSYYLKYQNLRASYITNFWKIINWDKVSEYAQYVIANKKGVSV